MDITNRCGRDGEVGVQHFQGVMARKRHGARQHLIEGHPQRIQIRALINRLMHPPGLLRRQIGQGVLESVGAHHRLYVLLASRGHPEINELDHPCVGVDDDIVRMDVQMHHPAAVYRFEPLGQLPREAQKGGERKTPRWHHLGERLGAKVLDDQGQPVPSVLKSIIVQDMRVSDGAADVEFVAEAGEILGRGAFVGCDLDDDGLLVRQPARAKDPRMCASRELLVYGIP
jgi:hypothetical protein